MLDLVCNGTAELAPRGEAAAAQPTHAAHSLAILTRPIAVASLLLSLQQQGLAFDMAGLQGEKSEAMRRMEELATLLWLYLFDLSAQFPGSVAVFSYLSVCVFL